MAKKATTKKAQTKETKVTETAPVKATAKKCATKKTEQTKEVKEVKEVKQSLVVEYQGKQVEETVMFDSVKAAWVEAGNKVEDIKTITLYVKPEEASVYYVINDTETGSVSF